MTSRAHKHAREQALLVSVAESIGSTLGTIAGRTNAAQKALTHSPVARAVKRDAEMLFSKTKSATRKTARAVRSATRSVRGAKKTVRRAKRAVRKAKTSASSAARRAKIATSAARRRVASSARRVSRRSRAKK